MNNEIIKLENAGVATLKSGAVRVNFIKRKQFGLVKGLTGAELRRQHDAYVADYSGKAKGVAAKIVATNHVTGFTQSANGHRVSIHCVDDLHAKKSTRESELMGKLAAMEQAFLAYKAANPAPVGA